MRAKIVGMIVLMGIAALSVSFTPVKNAAVQETLPRLLTEQEADCLVGGKATCVDVAVNEAESCLGDYGLGFDDIDDNVYTMVVGGYCAGSGIVSGLSCAWDWFTGLFG